MKIMITAKISTWEELMESMIVSTPATTTVECLRPFRGMGHTRPGGMTTGACMVMIAEFQSTQEILGFMQGQSLYKVWSTGTEHTEKGWIEAGPVEAVYTIPALSVLEEPSEPLRSLTTSDWRLVLVSSQGNQSLTLGLKTTEWLCTLVATVRGGHEAPPSDA